MALRYYRMFGPPPPPEGLILFTPSRSESCLKKPPLRFRKFVSSVYGPRLSMPGPSRSKKI